MCNPTMHAPQCSLRLARYKGERERNDEKICQGVPSYYGPKMDRPFSLYTQRSMVSGREREGERDIFSGERFLGFRVYCCNCVDIRLEGQSKAKWILSKFSYFITLLVISMHSKLWSQSQVRSFTRIINLLIDVFLLVFELLRSCY